MDEITRIENKIKQLKFRLKILKKNKKTFYCLKCGHSWFPRKIKHPNQCPRCRSVNWETGKPKNLVYGFADLEIGQSKTIPWNILPDGNMDNVKNYRIARAADSYSCRTGRKFRKDPDYTGLKITRIS